MRIVPIGEEHPVDEVTMIYLKQIFGDDLVPFFDMGQRKYYVSYWRLFGLRFDLECTYIDENGVEMHRMIGVFRLKKMKNDIK